MKTAKKHFRVWAVALVAAVGLMTYLLILPVKTRPTASMGVYGQGTGQGADGRLVETAKRGENPRVESRNTTLSVQQPQATGKERPIHDSERKDDQKALWKAFSEARHAVFTPNKREASMPLNKNVRYFMASPSQDLTFRFLDEGVRFESGQPGKDWKGHLRLKSQNIEEKTLPVQKGPNRVEYRHQEVTEWWENRREGLEQGFTFSQRPRQALGTGMLSLHLEVSGLTVSTDPSAVGALRFEDAESGAVARYSHLKAWDADGKMLPSRMEAVGSLIAIHVDDSKARYPVTVDPLITTLEQKFLPVITGDGAAGDSFGRAVALDGDTAVIGAYWDDTAAGSNTGSAYVFVRQGSAWGMQARLQANDGGASDEFGYAVSIHGDTVLIGAPLDDDPIAGVNMGSAYVFVRTGATWSLPTKLTASDGAASDVFGWSVTMHGQTALVGAYLDDHAAGVDAGSAYVFTLSGGSWVQQAKLIATDSSASDNFGYSVSLSGETALVGVYLDDSASGNDSGSASVFVRSAGVWTQQAQLLAPDAAAGDRLGASVSLDGDTALVAANFDDTISGGVNAGSAYVFVRSGSTWSFQAQLLPSDGQSGDLFGHSVSVYGSTALIGVVDGDNAPNSLTGSAYVFVRSGTSWSQQAKLVHANGKFNDQFGVRVALSGETALIGANFVDTDAGRDSGAAYVFVRTGSSWNAQAQLNAGNGADGDVFGLFVDIEGDTAVIGSQFADTPVGGNTGLVTVMQRSGNTWSVQASFIGSDTASGDELSYGLDLSGDLIVAGARIKASSTGAAYVFVRNAGVWTQQAKLTGDDSSTGDNFGAHVSIEGETILVGATFDDTSAGVDAGSVYVFRRNSGVWSQEAHLYAGDGAAGDNFGRTQISGNTALVGARFGDTPLGSDLGKAYVYVRNGSTWTQQAVLTASDGAASQFGYAVALSGNTALISSYGDDTAAGSNAGSAYVFRRTGSTWTEEAKLTASDGAAGDEFGRSVGLQDSTAVVGARYDDTNAGVNAGSVYVFYRSGSTWTEASQITAPDAMPGDEFGGLFNIGLDGGTLLVASYADDTPFPDFLPGYVAMNHGSVYVFRLNDAEIAVSDPNGFDLIDGSASVAFGTLNVGGPAQLKAFTVRNLGVLPLMGLSLVKGGSHQSNFAVNAGSLGSSVPAGGSSTFTVSYTSTSAGEETALLQITSNDVDENPFDIQLTGRAYSDAIDTDSDGMNDWQEFLLGTLGFDWLVPNAAMVNTYFSTANANGLYTTSQVHALNVGHPILQRNPATGEFTLTIGIQKSTDLINYSHWPMSAPQAVINGQGKLEYRFTVADDAAFFRLQSQ